MVCFKFPSPRSRSASTLTFKATGHSTKLLNISISFYNGRKKGNGCLTHTFAHPPAPQFRPLVAFITFFLALLFRSFLPVRFFLFTRVCILPGSSTTMPCFISALQDLRPLEPMGCQAHAKAIRWWMTVVSHRGITK